MGTDVVISEMRRAAAAADEAAGIADSVDWAGLLALVGKGMAGSRSAASAAGLAQAWTDRVGRWSTDVRGYGDNLVAAADLYTANEDQATRDLTPTGGR